MVREVRPERRWPGPTAGPQPLGVAGAPVWEVHTCQEETHSGPQRLAPCTLHPSYKRVILQWEQPSAPGYKLGPGRIPEKQSQKDLAPAPEGGVPGCCPLAVFATPLISLR